MIASTGTVLGFDLSENPATQLYHVKFGYARTEVAFVPTNLYKTNSAGGAEETADVIMELRYQDVLKGGGLYQRLAVGKVACAQPGSAFMFAKDSTGQLSPAAAQAVVSAFQRESKSNLDVIRRMNEIVDLYTASSDKGRFDAAAVQLGYPSFLELSIDPLVSKDVVEKLAKLLGL